jgi:hypothetical protein
MVIVPSTRFYETLCVAEQGQERDPDHQHPVYHSVIPNALAKQYEDQKIFPNGLLRDVALGDKLCYVPVVIPCGTEMNQTILFLVRIVTIKRSKDYKGRPKNGSCCLSNRPYFESCARIFDSVWENKDIEANVDVCLITGESGPHDKGCNEILLAGRIYRKNFEMPGSHNPTEKIAMQNKFLSSCYNSIKKKGFVTYRTGGSAGDNGATAEQLEFFQKNPG